MSHTSQSSQSSGGLGEYRVQFMYGVYHFAAQPVVIILDDYVGSVFGPLVHSSQACPAELGMGTCILRSYALLDLDFYIDQ